MKMFRYSVAVVVAALSLLGSTGCVADTFVSADSGDPACCGATPDQDSGVNPQNDAGDAGTCTTCADAGDAATNDSGDAAVLPDGSQVDGSTADAGDAGTDASTCTNGDKQCIGTTVNECSANQWQYLDSTQTDPDNCGACGHSCQGGTCSLGICQPIASGLIKSAGMSPQPITTDGVNVFWGDSNSLKSAPVGGGATTVLASGINAPKAIVQDASNVYWISYGSTNVISWCSKTSCTPQTLWSGTKPINALALDDTNVYWTQDNAFTGDPIAQECSKTACTTPTILATLQAIGQNGYASGIAVNGTNVYWVDYYYQAGDHYEIDYCAISGCTTPTTLYSLGTTAASLIAVDGLNVYWGGGNTINQCDKILCSTPKVLASGQTSGSTGPTQIVVDNSTNNVFWSNYDQFGTGDIRACKIGMSCGNLQTSYNNVATGPQGRSPGIALDSSAKGSIYWTNCDWSGNNGTIQKVAK